MARKNVYSLGRSHWPFLIGVSLLSTAAGILYSSWPLGYWLNASVSRVGLASGLQAVGQPYNWLFIGLDIASSALAITFAWILWRKYKTHGSRSIGVVLVSVTAFSVATIIDALIPERCVPNLQQCQSFTRDHVLLAHGFFSITASLFLFVGLFVAWFYHRKSLLLTTFLLGYILFGVISLIEAITPGKDGNWSQHYYITLCSLWLICTPYALNFIAQRHLAATSRHHRRPPRRHPRPA